MAVVNAGEAGIVSGWSTPVQMVTGKPLSDKQHRVWTGCHAVKNKWVLESNTGESGNSLAWVKEMLFDHSGNEGDDYSRMDAAALAGQPGAGDVLAFTARK